MYFGKDEKSGFMLVIPVTCPGAGVEEAVAMAIDANGDLSDRREKGEKVKIDEGVFIGDEESHMRPGVERRLRLDSRLA